MARNLTIAIPPQHPHRPKRVPLARFALALVHREMQPARMGILEGPPTVRIALGLDEFDRLGHPLVRRDARAAHVVESSEHVVVPVGRVGELREGWVDQLASRQPAQQAAFKEVLLAAEAGRPLWASRPWNVRTPAEPSTTSI